MRKASKNARLSIPTQLGIILITELIVLQKVPT